MSGSLIVSLPMCFGMSRGHGLLVTPHFGAVINGLCPDELLVEKET